jgi:hypothetical protein
MQGLKCMQHCFDSLVDGDSLASINRYSQPEMSLRQSHDILRIKLHHMYSESNFITWRDSGSSLRDESLKVGPSSYTSSARERGLSGSSQIDWRRDLNHTPGFVV